MGCNLVNRLFESGPSRRTATQGIKSRCYSPTQDPSFTGTENPTQVLTPAMPPCTNGKSNYGGVAYTPPLTIIFRSGNDLSMTLPWLDWNPRNVLLLDLLGALTTSFVTGCLLATEVFATGVPVWILAIMAAVALGFACYDAVGLAMAFDPRATLAGTAILNLIYCAASLLVCYTYADKLTLLGKIYFPVEVLVVGCLAVWEWKMAKRRT